MDKDNWISIEKELPEEGVLVDTKIDDDKGIRNEAQLKRNNHLWLLSDGSMYVYYNPTHWKILNQ